MKNYVKPYPARFADTEDVLPDTAFSLDGMDSGWYSDCIIWINERAFGKEISQSAQSKKEDKKWSLTKMILL